MNILSRWLMKRLGQATGRYLKAHGLLKVNKHNPAILWTPEDSRVAVLAPHMDDEIIGCGGTLSAHVLAGATVTVVYMTDGRYGGALPSHPAGDQPRPPATNLVALRRQEALRAMETLGIQHVVFLDAEDSQLSSAQGLPDRIREILRSIQPDLVYLPFFLEEHPDHRAVTQILIEAAEGISGAFDCCGYEVWTPLFPNCVVDISEAVGMKRQALQQYQSQLLETDYLHASLGLNAYRSIALSGKHGGFAEAFFRTSFQDYRALYHAYCTSVPQVNGS
jgi:N-acetylglucosamine malate deacetylase 1